MQSIGQLEGNQQLDLSFLRSTVCNLQLLMLNAAKVRKPPDLWVLPV
jgi:hypothetical protein